LNGVPLLVIPMGRDQGDNAARVVAHGTGLSLADAATEQEIVFAVRRLITEPRFRAAAVRLGKTMAQNLTSPILVTEMEQMAMRRWRRSA
jgi:UDP:flavonoid glycosyltransferase YjiC (YdhE family)